jgi:hypothetical protein
MLLELDNVNRNAIEWSTGFISTRTAADIFLHLALDARNAIICPLITLAIGSYLETGS